MKLSDLISRLEEIQELHGGQVDVYLATQPQYPVSHNAAGVKLMYYDKDERELRSDVQDLVNDPHSPQVEPAVYISSYGTPEKPWGPYAPKEAFED